jgi:ABC-type lipoprotein export system ATPase subunit
VLDGVTFALRAGERVSIRGESGSGKTTLLNLLAGIEQPDTGTVTWQGAAIAALSRAELARRRARLIGMVFQAYYLIPELTALDNVALAARMLGVAPAAARRRAAELLAEVGLAERVASLPLQLSGGERQRVAFARALINEPAVVLADEPTGNLDEASAQRVMACLFETTARRGAAFVLVTHHAGFAAEAERRLLLHGGKLRENAGAERGKLKEES